MFEKFLNSITKKMDPNLRRLLTYLPKYKGMFIASMIFMALSGSSSSLIATFLGKLTDIGFYEKATWMVVGAPICLIFIAALNGFCVFMSSYLLAKVSQSILVTLRTQLFTNILYWPSYTYQRNPTGLIASKFVNEANVALSNAAKSIIVLVRDSVQVVGLMGILVYYNWQLTLVTLFIAPIIAFVLRKISQRIKQIVASSQQSIASMLVRVQETYEAHRVVKVYNNYSREITRFEDVNNSIKKIALLLMKISSMGSPITQLITMVGVAVVVAVALFEAQHGLLTMGEFITFLSAMLLMMQPLKQLTNLNAAFVGISVAAGSIFATMDEALENDNGKKTVDRVKGNIVFEGVSLKYPESNDFALKNFNLNVKAGESIALVGQSGSGKSSLVNLLPRFWEPTEGRILLDNDDYRELTLESLRNQIAVVSQDVVMFDDTIRVNIAYGVPNATDEDIYKVIEAAALTDFIQSLPEGLNTPVGEAGNRLSGGQKQRISIARALLKDSPILILDEATSALDSESEHHVKEALEHLMKGRTCFTVAHRLSTIEKADRIIVMSKGEIQEMGTHSDLLAKNGIYANLVKLQSMKTE